MKKLKIEMLDESVPKVRYSSDGSACIDLYARTDVTIPPMVETLLIHRAGRNNETNEDAKRAYLKDTVKLIPLNIKIEHGESEFTLLFPRSSLSIKRGLVMANGVGVIDNDFKDEVMLPVYNITPFTTTVKKGEKVAQLLVTNYDRYIMEWSNVISDSDHTGFGSTGNE